MVTNISQDLLPASSSSSSSSSSSPTSKLKKEAASSCEKLITAYETIQCHKLEENNPNFQHYENLK
jgi:hypothetical protein